MKHSFWFNKYNNWCTACFHFFAFFSPLAGSSFRVRFLGVDLASFAICFVAVAEAGVFIKRLGPWTSPAAVKHTHRTFVVNGTHTHCQSHSHTISYYSCAREPPHADDPIWNCNDESFESIVNKYIEMVALHKALKKSLADITCFTWGLSLHCFARSVRHLKLLVYHSFKLLLVWTY